VEKKKKSIFIKKQNPSLGEKIRVKRRCVFSEEPRLLGQEKEGSGGSRNFVGSAETKGKGTHCLRGKYEGNQNSLSLMKCTNKKKFGGRRETEQFTNDEVRVGQGKRGPLTEKLSGLLLVPLQKPWGLKNWNVVSNLR